MTKLGLKTQEVAGRQACEPRALITRLIKLKNKSEIIHLQATNYKEKHGMYIYVVFTEKIHTFNTNLSLVISCGKPCDHMNSLTISYNVKHVFI